MPLSRRQVRAALGVLWLVDAALQAQPDFFRADWWRNDLAQSVMGQPTTINHSIYWVIDIVAAHAAVANTIAVGVQLALGLALLLGRHERAAILVSIPWALGIWWVGEGFGTLPTGFALAATGAPGPVLLYPLLGLLAWPRHRRSIDADPVARSGAAAWVMLWAGQAILQVPWVFPARQALLANISEYSQGQPGWLQAIAHTAATMAGHHPLAVTVAMAAAQTAVGIGIISPAIRRGALAAGIALSVVYWFSFQYLGGIAGGGATDPGTAPLVILLALTLWPEPQLKISPARAKTRATASPIAAAVVSVN